MRCSTPWAPYTASPEDIVGHTYKGSGVAEDPFIVDWIAEDDNGNPRNWPAGYRWSLVVLMSAITLFFTVGSSSYSASIPSIKETYPGYTDFTYISGLSLYVAGYALGPLVWAPLSEMFGRRPIFIISFATFVSFCGGVTGAQNIWTLSILRFFAGAGGSSVVSNFGGTIVDLFTSKDRGMALSIWTVAPTLGPIIGPVLGGFVSDAIGWRWVCGIVTILAGAGFLLGSLFLPETYEPVLLRQRAVFLAAENKAIYVSKDDLLKTATRRHIWRNTLVRPWKLLFWEPIVLLLSIYIACVFASLYLLFASYPIIYQAQRGWSSGITGLTFIGIGMGFMLALVYQSWYENPRYVQLSKETSGAVPPEERLVECCIGSFFLPAGMFWFAWTASPVTVHWIVSVIASVLSGFGMILIFFGITLYLIDSYARYAASVTAANTVFRYMGAALLPLFTKPMYIALGINWASSLIAFVALVCVPLPFIFYHHGASIRGKSRYAKQLAFDHQNAALPSV